MKRWIPRLAAAALAAATLAANGQEFGANFNHNPDNIELEYLKKTPVQWVRTTPYIFEYIRGERDVATDEGLAKLLAAHKLGYRIAFGYRWDFRKHRVRVPAAGSDEEKRYFDMARRLLDRVGPAVSMFKLGNEVNLETLPEDLQRGADGVVPIVRFTQRLLSEVALPYFKARNAGGGAMPDIYVGSFPRLFLPDDQNYPAVQDLLKWTHEDPRITGLAIHLHVDGTGEMDTALAWVRERVPKKPLIVPEFSLFRLYNKHTTEELGATPAGAAFAKQYGYAPTMKLYEWYSKANSQRVPTAEWQAMFDSRAWFPRHFMRTFCERFRNNGVVLATYGYMSQSAPEQMTPTSPTWFINPIFPMKSLARLADGSYAPNPLWHDDFVACVQEGKRWAAGRGQR
jgi:hypothetical protein